LAAPIETPEPTDARLPLGLRREVDDKERATVATAPTPLEHASNQEMSCEALIFHSGPAIGGLLQTSPSLSRGLHPAGCSVGQQVRRFLLAWALLNLGVAPCFAFYPLLMRELRRRPEGHRLFSRGCDPRWLDRNGARAARFLGPRLVFRAGLAQRSPASRC
jgi:hypothetical protein